MLRFKRECLLAAIRVLSVATGVALAAPVWAFSTGNVGVSGKQGATCNACHAGGTDPTIMFDGPAQLEPGAQGTYTFSVQSNAPAQIGAGFNVAASDGELDVLAGQGARRQQFPQGGLFEVTHTMPKSNTEGVATWEFTWQAPASEGMFTLFGSGNSVDLNSQSFGDRSASTTLAVMVSAAVDTPTPTTVGDTPTPTPTLGPVPCVGDCDASGAVAINELIIGVNIALDVAPVTECAAFDVDVDERVSVNELVSGVNAALGECE